jgi:hypothetical protein
MSRRGLKRAAPRMHICTAGTVIAVHGAGPHGVSHVLTAGAHVDFDEVIGHGPDGPVTLEAALGPHVQFFQPARPAPAVTLPQDEE